MRRRLFSQTLQGAKGIFEAMDLESTGRLTAPAFAKAMERLDLGLNAVQISEIFVVLDSRTGAVNVRTLLSFPLRM